LRAFGFSWKWRKRSPSKVKERTHVEATEALHTPREGRHPQAVSAGEGADLELCDEFGLQPMVFYRWQKEFFENSSTVNAQQRPWLM